MTDALNIRPTTDDLVMSIDTLKKTYLFGVSLLDDDGNAMTDEMMIFYIKSAQEWFQREINIRLLPTAIVGEAHDYYYTDLINNGFLRLFQKPVRSMSRYAITFPLTDSAIEFDTRWFRVDSVSGMVNVIPGRGAIDSFLSNFGQGSLLAAYGDEYVPFAVTIDYVAGFEVGKVPGDILDVIGMQASLGILDIAGDLLGGAGIASKSLSLDGLSESISTTSSPENSGYGARVRQYTKQIDARMATLRTSYGGISMVMG